MQLGKYPISMIFQTVLLLDAGYEYRFDLTWGPSDPSHPARMDQSLQMYYIA